MAAQEKDLLKALAKLVTRTGSPVPGPMGPPKKP